MLMILCLMGRIQLLQVASGNGEKSISQSYGQQWLLMLLEHLINDPKFDGSIQTTTCTW
jgi:hypothetical protein